MMRTRSQAFPTESPLLAEIFTQEVDIYNYCSVDLVSPRLRTLLAKLGTCFKRSSLPVYLRAGSHCLSAFDRKCLPKIRRPDVIVYATEERIWERQQAVHSSSEGYQFKLLT